MHITTSQQFVKPSNIMLGFCPHCREKLSRTVILQRKIKKKCKCRKCGQSIDERYLVY